MAHLREISTDLLIIGGGINGTGIAADAAGRGLSVVLCEQDDLAAATSSASSKLIHGGLRYLELFDFKLVHECLQEREILLNIAPHLIHPLQFILPHAKHLRSKLQIQLGLFLYDHLAHSSLPKAKKINLLTSTEGLPLKPSFSVGFSYFDAQTDDVRLVISNALTTQQHGGIILTRTVCVKATRQGKHWLAELYNKHTHEKIFVTCKAMVNATGPWVDKFLKDVVSLPSTHQVELVKGSHIVVHKLYDGDHAYILQNQDQRIVFIIPYQQQFTLIGTTDLLFSGSPHEATISDAEIDYLCTSVNDYFANNITKKDIVWSYSGVRPLLRSHQKQARKISREYYLEINDAPDQAPLVSVFGGKLTTFRKLAEDLLMQLKKYFSHLGKPWTGNTFFPGGDLQGLSFNQFLAAMQARFPWLPKNILQRYALGYGSNMDNLLTQAASLHDLGEHFGAGLYEKEVLYLMQNEWAQSADDILWRRTKLGLFLTAEQKEKLATFISQRITTGSASKQSSEDL